MLPNMRSLIKKHLPVLHSDTNLKNIFSENSIFLREIEISKKYYLRHYIPNVKMTKKLILLKIVVNVIFVKKF